MVFLALDNIATDWPPAGLTGTQATTLGWLMIAALWVGAAVNGLTIAVVIRHAAAVRSKVEVPVIIGGLLPAAMLVAYSFGITWWLPTLPIPMTVAVAVAGVIAASVAVTMVGTFQPFQRPHPPQRHK